MARNTTSLWIGLAMAGALGATQAQAADKDMTPKGRAAALQTVVDCRTITDSAARLACYDGAIAKLDAAEASGEVVVVDRGQVREARRAAFGFNFQLPGFMTRGDKPEEVENLTAKVASARLSGEGKWVIVLDDGAVWRQTDRIDLPRRPKPGSTVELRKGALGSYFMKLDGQVGVRAERSN